MSHVMKLEFGMKDNWREFYDFVKRNYASFGEYYFVFDEDGGGDDAYVFDSHSDLDEWLQQKFWTWGYYERSNLEDSMDNIKVWKLISEKDFLRLDTLYAGARKTSIVIGGETYYRKLINIRVEPTVSVSTNFY